VVLDVRYSALHDDDGTPRGVIGVAIDISDRRRAEREREEAQERLRRSHLALRERGRERRRLMAALVTVQEEERRQIAAGIHDDTLQVLANLGFHLERLRRRSIARGADTDVLDHLDVSLQLAVDRLRRLVFELRPAALDGEGILPALKDLVQGLRDENGLVVDLTGAILSEPTGETRVALYRVAREALSNVRKHSSSRRCELSLEEIDGWYHLVVRDDGTGFDPARAPEPGHIGLPSMKEHTLIMGGRMEVNSAPGEGTTVSIWLPGEADARAATERG
jgi:signal transduction histidine kinase